MEAMIVKDEALRHEHNRVDRMVGLSMVYALSRYKLFRPNFSQAPSSVE